LKGLDLAKALLKSLPWRGRSDFQVFVGFEDMRDEGAWAGIWQFHASSPDELLDSRPDPFSAIH
jgi:hypothetical protein